MKYLDRSKASSAFELVPLTFYVLCYILLQYLYFEVYLHCYQTFQDPHLYNAIRLYDQK